jgi:competence ComEA-like helix-hairpin-helix protein
MAPQSDWTTGPAKWAAVAVLGLASIGGMTWSIFTRQPSAAPVPARALHVAPESLEPDSEAVPATPIASPTPKPAPTRPTPSSIAHIVNINTAASAELELLPGIGPALAGRIISYRTEFGPFKTVDEIDSVKGIGPRTLEKLRPLIKVD